MTDQPPEMERLHREHDFDGSVRAAIEFLKQPGLSRSDRGTASFWLGISLRNRGQPGDDDLALANLREAVRHLAVSDEGGHLPWAYDNLARHLYDHGQFADAASAFREALQRMWAARARTHDSPKLLVRSLTEAHDADAARTWAAAGVSARPPVPVATDASEEQLSVHQQAEVDMWLGWAARSAADPDEAARHVRRALEHFDSCDPSAAAFCWSELGLSLVDAGQSAYAIEPLSAAASQYAALGDQLTAAARLESAGYAAYRTDQFALAVPLLVEAEALFRSAGEDHRADDCVYWRQASAARQSPGEGIADLRSLRDAAIVAKDYSRALRLHEYVSAALDDVPDLDSIVHQPGTLDVVELVLVREPGTMPDADEPRRRIKPVVALGLLQPILDRQDADELTRALAQLEVSSILFDLHRYDEALQVLEPVAAGIDRLGLPKITAAAYERLGALYFNNSHSDAERALDCFAKAIQAYKASDAGPAMLGHCYWNTIPPLRALGRNEEADVHQQLASDLIGDARDFRYWRVMNDRIHSLLEKKLFAEAHELGNKLLDELDPAHFPGEAARLYRLYGMIFNYTNRPDLGLPALRAALELFVDRNDFANAADTERQIAEILADTDPPQLGASLEHFDRAEQNFLELGETVWLARTRVGKARVLAELGMTDEAALNAYTAAVALDRQRYRFSSSLIRSDWVRAQESSLATAFEYALRADRFDFVAVLVESARLQALPLMDRQASVPGTTIALVAPPRLSHDDSSYLSAALLAAGALPLQPPPEVTVWDSGTS